MRRKGSLIRIEAIREVRTSVATFGNGVVERLDARRPAPPEGEPVFTYQMVFDDLNRDLETVQDKLIVAEDAHTRSRIRRTDLARTSEELTTGLYDRQVATRRTLAGLYGPDRGFEVAAIEGDTPRGLGGLVDQVDQTVQLLRQPEVDLVPVVEGGEELLDAMAGRLETGLENLTEVRVDLDKARKAVNETVIARTKAIEEYDGVFPWVARALESYFRLVGETELANRIRTSVRRVTRRQADEEEEGDVALPASGSSDAGEEAASEPAEAPSAAAEAS